MRNAGNGVVQSFCAGAPLLTRAPISRSKSAAVKTRGPCLITFLYLVFVDKFFESQLARVTAQACALPE